MRKKIFCFCAAGLFLISGCVSIKTVSYSLSSDKFIEGTSLGLILIADLHSTVYGENQRVLIEKIRSAAPDAILLAGDIVDDAAPIAGTRLLLEGVKDIAPLYYVTGNHEYMRKDFQEIMDELRAYGVRVLSDEYERIEIRGNSITVAGVEDPYRGFLYEYHQEESMRKAFAALRNLKEYTILIAHRPERIAEYTRYGFDLIVSGHAHGGQVRIPPLINGLYAPDQGLFPKYAGGLYRHGGVSHIVSRGLSLTHPRLPRIFNPPELVYITVTSSD
ncbi:MAG: metallophosphoesterase [Spirochaetaceae bacterium]|jgi:predicted MPP superfamily phosphohydrolase|nr:metallophosphoesterase [Spirochaetaceae bacterium]